GERGRELLDVLGDAAQGFFHQLRCGVHFDAGLHGALGLFGQVGSAAVPELGDVEHRVQYRGRVARAVLPAVTHRCGDVVGATGTHAVAGITGDDVALGQARFEPQPAAKINLFLCQALFLDHD